MPLRLPVLGHILSYAREPLRFLERASRLGPFARVDLAGMRGILVNEPEVVEAICVTHNRQLRKDRFARDLQRVSSGPVAC